MDKNSPKGRKRKRANEEVEDHFWDCSICTYKNNPKAFKCLMCDVGRGTSTRKSRLNPDLAAMQVQRAQTPPPRALREDHRSSNDDGSLTRPGSSASNSSNDVPVTTNTDVASPEKLDVPPTHVTPEPGPPDNSYVPPTPGPGPSNQSTPPSSSAKGSNKPKDPNATPKEKNVKPPVTRKPLRNIDKKNATHHSVTVDSVTFVITEYKLKPKKDKKVKELATPMTAHSPTPPIKDEESPNVNKGGSSTTTMENNHSAENQQKSEVQV